MPATGFEQIGSRHGNKSQANRKYFVSDAETEEDLFNWINANVPETIANLSSADFSYREIDEITHTYEVDASWGFGTPFDLGTTEYKFNHQAGGGHFVQSLATISYSSATGTFGTALGAGVRNFKGAINVVNDDGKRKVEGQDIQAPPETFILSIRSPLISIDASYQLLVESLVGMVNSTTFRGRPAGSVMLVRASGQKSGGVWAIEFGFAYIANRTNIPVGDDIVVSAKDGMDLLWPYYETVKDDDYGDALPNPTAAYVERVFYRADLNLLNLPA